MNTGLAQAQGTHTVSTTMISLRPATDEDKTFLKHLTKTTSRDLVEKQFGVWDDADQERRFEEKWRNHDYQILEVDGVASGALWMSRETDHLWLREILIVPSQQNRGIGTEVLQGLVKKARSLKLPLRLRVLTLNRAKQLYERAGFKVTGRQENTHFWMEHVE